MTIPPLFGKEKSVEAAAAETATAIAASIETVTLSQSPLSVDTEKNLDH